MNNGDLKKVRKVYCGNCGKIGHIYKHCKEPIISLGIILYRLHNGRREYLMVMRKDSLGYVELIRGNYPLDDMEYLNNIFEEMTLEEKHKIITCEFAQLWNELWVEDEEKKVKYQKEFHNSMKQFERLREGVDINGEHVTIHDLVSNSRSKWTEPEWGFPKGRRNLKERDMQCAIREFEEEADITRDEIYVLRCIDPLSENFIGSNKKAYRHIYYVAKMIEPDMEPKLNPDLKIQMIEIGDIRWFTLEDALTKIRCYNREKKDTLVEADEIVAYMEPT